jgi:ABC-type transport system involved in cytochrome c biogenesis permease subunit
MPENFDKTLMPALQSPWFAPHVIVYILGYAFLGLSAIFALIGLATYYLGTFDNKWLPIGDNLVVLGYSFITLGLIFGALWAKEAWGHYWTWDPKETWAFITWAAYLIYMHIRYYRPQKSVSALWILVVSFVILLIAWFGLSYLPSAQNSVHIYSNYQ